MDEVDNQIAIASGLKVQTNVQQKSNGKDSFTYSDVQKPTVNSSDF